MKLWIAPNYRDRIVDCAATYDFFAGSLPETDYVEKQGRSTGRYRLDIGGESSSVYVKKYYALPWSVGVFGSLERFPGPAELERTRRVAELGIRVPEPVIAGADRNRRCRSFLAIRELEGFSPLHQYLPSRFGRTDGGEDRRLARRLVDRVAEVSARLHAASLYHRDLYLCHFFVRETDANDDGFELALIDWLRLTESRLPRWRIKDLAQLLFSSDLPGVRRADRVRFLREYLAVDRLDAAAKTLSRRVGRKAAEYRRHNEKRAA